jgi:hypothetical protein
MEGLKPFSGIFANGNFLRETIGDCMRSRFFLANLLVGSTIGVNKPRKKE